MIRTPIVRATAVAFTAVLALAPALEAQRSRSVPQGGTVELGTRPAHEFRASVWNGLGVQSLEHLRGRPVLVEFWSMTSPACVASAVPAALRLQEKFGDDLTVLFVECSGKKTKSADTVAFALREGWLGGRALWTKEVPFYPDKMEFPRFGLLNSQGELILQGEADRLGSQIEKEVERDLKLGGPKDLHPKVSKLWREMAKGNHAKAFDAAVALAEKENDKEIVQGALWLLESGRAQLENDLRRVRWMIDNGYPLEADALVQRLARSVKGREAAYLPSLGDVTEALASESLKNERAAAKALRKLESKLFKDGPGVKIARSLTRFAQKHAGTRSAARADQLAVIASM